MAQTPLFLLNIELDSGIERVSSREVRAPSKTWEPFIVSWGVFENGIPSPPGLPIVGDAKFTLAESQARKWRDLFAHQTPRRRKVTLWAMFEGEAFTTSPPRAPFFTGEIVDAVFNPDRSIDLTCRDMTYAWIDEPIPALITKEFYPDLPDRYEGQFLPIVVGQVRTIEESPPSSPVEMAKRGQIALPRMGWNQDTGDRWGVAAHPCANVVVYRRVDIAVDGDQIEEWELVDPGEYTENFITLEAFNVVMHHEVIDFFVEQPDGTELRADIDGYYVRGPWGDLPQVGEDLTSPPQGSFASPPMTALRNPIDFFISMTYLILNKAGVSGGDGSVFDTDDIGALRTKFESLGILCDGAITEPLTCREFLAQFHTSFNVDMWQKRNGKISLAFTDEENLSRDIYTETDLILKNTFTERLIEKHYNQFQYRHQYNYAEDQWGQVPTLDTSDQDILAIGTTPKVEKEIVDLVFVRDSATALAVIQHRSQFLSLGSYSQDWEIPLPETPVTLEPSSLIGVTHRMGLETGGYVNREVKVLRLRHDFDKLTTKVTGILRVPQTILSPP